MLILMKKMRQKNENSTCAVLKSSTEVAADTVSSHKANFHIVQSLSKKFHNSRKTSFYYIA